MVLRKLIFFSSLLCTYILTTEVVSEQWSDCRQNILSIQETSLLFHSWSIYSQFGEEGILDEILKRLDLMEGMFIEFSNFYETCTSNVRFLAERGWQGIFVDIDDDHSSKNRKSYQYIVPLAPILCLEETLYFKDVTHFPDVRFIKESKEVDKNIFDQIVRSLCRGKEIDILSIDVGGFDDLILEGIQHKPKMIIIKAGMYWSPFLVEKIPLEIATNGLNQPLTVLISLARNQGYTPVCYTGNLILVRDDIACLFNEIVKDPITLWMDAWHYFLEKKPSYISWVIENRASKEDIRKFDSFSIPNYINH